MKYERRAIIAHDYYGLCKDPEESNGRYDDEQERAGGDVDLDPEDEDLKERDNTKRLNKLPAILLPIILFMLSCTKQDATVRLHIATEANRLYYSFSYQGAGYTPTDTTHVEMTGYRFTLPANEASGYMVPAGYDSADGRARVINNPTVKIVQL